MSFLKSKGFKYFKNLIIGLGAAVVLLGALAKLISHPLADIMLTVGLLTEAGIFAFLGIIGPEPDYYWEKLYPGLNEYNAQLTPLASGSGSTATPLNGEVVERNLSGMLNELQVMSKSMSSLKALQEADFSGTSEQIKTMNNFYTKLNSAMSSLAETADDAVAYKDQMKALNTNLSSLNNVYGSMLSAMSNIGR